MKKVLFAVVLFFLSASPIYAVAAQPAGQILQVPPGPAYSQTTTNVTNSFIDYKTVGKIDPNVVLGNYTSGLMAYFGLSITGAKDEKGQAVIPGAMDFFAGSISYMASTRPASGVDYVKYMAGRLEVPGTPDSAYAATPGVSGVGFSSLTPVLQIWTVFRNVAYVIFAVIFVFVGLMIVLRVKIDPKTTASIQSALPKMVFALIIVTFSYAIAGFLIDIMYVAIALLLTILKQASPAGSTFGTNFESEVLSGQTIFGFALNGGIQISGGAFNEVNTIIQQWLSGVPIIGSTSSSPFQLPGASNLIGILGGGIAFLIVAIAILWALFKTWLMLLGAYVNIILAIVFAPLRLTLEAVPGQNQFGGWVKDLLANLLTFPLVIALIFIGLLLSSNTGAQFNVPGAQGFVPPLIGGNSQAAIQSLLGVGILLTIPKALDILREWLKAPAFKYGNAWSEAVKFGSSPFVGGARGVYKNWYDENIGIRAKNFEAQKEAEIKYRLDPNADPNKPVPTIYTKPNLINRIIPPKPF